MITELFTESEADIRRAGQILRRGGLVAFPTETVYGLGANALDEEAVKKIYAAKGRPSDNPLIVHVGRKEDIAPLVKEITPKAKALIDAFFPAPLTIILPKSDMVGKTVSGGLDTVAVRMPQNETARRLILAAGCPVAAPSANTSGLPSPTRAKYVMEDMNGRIDAVIDGGDCAFGVESTVITLAEEPPVILRPGAVTREMIESVIGEVRVAKAVLEGMGENETAASPGMKYKHYAPRARVMLVDADKTTYESFVNSRPDAFALCYEGDDVRIPKVTFGRENDDLSQARELFDALRELDEMGAKKVYARIPRVTGVGMAVYNRLIRAAAFQIIDLKKPFTIGLTGQTGAGKSYICEYLKSLGFCVLDSDRTVRELYDTDKALLKTLSERFGQDILDHDVLDRKRLAKIVFADGEKLKTLNSIVHPKVIKACAEKARIPSVLDAPQLFEAGAADKCYRIISVCAPEEVRLERIMERDGISKEQAKARMNAQLDEEYYKKHAHFVLNNDGRADIKKQIDLILEDIL